MSIEFPGKVKLPAASEISNDDQYYLRGSSLSETKFVSINKLMFDEIAEAHKFYVDIILIEENYDTVVENYYEFERELIDIVARHMLFDVTDEVFLGQTSLVNRRLLNLLSAVRMYTDHTRRQLIKSFGKKSAVLCSFQDKSRNLKETNAGFFLLDHVRNYSQHAGYAVDSFSVGTSFTPVGDSRLRLYDMESKLSISEIVQDPRTDPALKSRISEIEQKDAKDVIRDGIDGLSELHQHLRDNIEEHLLVKKDVLLSALLLFSDSSPKTAADDCPSLIHQRGNERVYQRYISRDIVNRLGTFRRKNKHLKGLSNWRVIS